MPMHSRRTASAVLSSAVLALLPVLMSQGVTAWAQAPNGGPANSAGDGKIHTSKTVFHLPIKIDERLRGDLREVYLYVKDGVGPWLRKESVAPTQTHFTFRVPHDGEYWFSVVTMDRHGRMTPPDVAKEAPGLMVVVDTRPTEVMAAAPPTISGPPATPGMPPAPPSTVTAPAPTLPAAPPALPAAAPALPPAMTSTATALPPPLTLPPAPETTVSRLPSLPSNVINNTPRSSGPAASGSGNRQLLNTTRAAIDYRIDQVGPSGVGKVEVWLTTDEGHTWQRYGEDADRRSPAEINLPGEGLFGIRLVVTNGNGFGGKTPAAGDVPSSLIEVDLTKPYAQLREIEPVGTNGTVDIRWTASDKNLGPEPISLFYAPSREGPWLPVATNVRNEGVYHWAFPHSGISQFVLRLECTDLAGNMTRCETQAPVMLDTTEPQVQVLGVNGIHGLHPSGN